MVLLLYFSVTLFFAVLISCLAKQTVVSTGVLFLGAGVLLGSRWLGAQQIPNENFLEVVSEVALFSVLFTDGMRIGGLSEIRKHWRLPLRALMIGMPLTIALIGFLSHWLTGLNWQWSFLIGAVLSPTDPVFVSAIFEVEAVPQRLKRLLNIESGLNDGLALPAVLLLLSTVGAHNAEAGQLTLELLGGVGLGVAVPLAGIWLEQTRFFGAAGIYEPLNAFALGLLVLALSYIAHVNLFLAAFAAGITIASRNQAPVESFHQFGDLIAELLKLGTLLIFGARIAPSLFSGISVADFIFVVLSIFVVRTIAITVSFVPSGLPWWEVLTVGWFGPKGFASVVYGLMILRVGTSDAHLAAKLVAFGIVASIVVYSSTDILVGHWYAGRQQEREAH